MERIGKSCYNSRNRPPGRYSRSSRRAHAAVSTSAAHDGRHPQVLGANRPEVLRTRPESSARAYDASRVQALTEQIRWPSRRNTKAPGRRLIGRISSTLAPATRRTTAPNGPGWSVVRTIRPRTRNRRAIAGKSSANTRRLWRKRPINEPRARSSGWRARRPPPSSWLVLCPQVRTSIRR